MNWSVIIAFEHCVWQYKIWLLISSRQLIQMILTSFFKNIWPVVQFLTSTLASTVVRGTPGSTVKRAAVNTRRSTTITVATKTASKNNTHGVGLHPSVKPALPKCTAMVICRVTPDCLFMLCFSLGKFFKPYLIFGGVSIGICCICCFVCIARRQSSSPERVSAGKPKISYEY